eukprot:15434_1
MPRKSNCSYMACTDLISVSSTFNKSLRIIHSATPNKPSKIVVGDQSGTITCFKWIKEEIHTTFQQKKDEPITALTLDDDKIVIAYGQTIETIRKKGKILSKFNLSLNEDVTSLQAKGDTIWCCGEYVYNCYKNQKESHFFMSKDIINDIILIDLGFEQLCAVIACQDKAIRVLYGSELLFEIETNCNTTALHEIECKGERENCKQIVYGLQNGSIGAIKLNKETIYRVWLLYDDNNQGSVNCISSYDFMNDGFPEIIVGRDNGNIDIFECKKGNKPHILHTLQSLNESITAIDIGYVTGISNHDIIIATYSGKIKAFHCDPSRDFAAWEHAEINASYISHISHKKMRKSNLINIEQDISNYKREIATLKSKYQDKSKELIATNTQFHLKHCLKLLESEAAYLLTLEIGIPIDLVVVQCSVEIVSLDIDEYFGLQAQHKNMEGNNNNCFIFHCINNNNNNITRFKWKLRICEGQQGLLTAFISSTRIPKTCQSCTFSIRALSLHSSIYYKQIEEEKIFSERPMNTFEMNGEWTVREFNSWLSKCIPDVSLNIFHNEISISLSWQSIFVGDYVTVNFKNGSAIFKSDSVTTIAILQELLTKLAIKNNVTITNVNINIDSNSIIHFFNLIQPKLEYHHKIHQQHSWINALKEIESHEDDLTCLNHEMQNILKNSHQIEKDFKTSPKHLQFIKNMIWNNILNYAKLENINISLKNEEKLKRGLDSTDCDMILSVMKDIIK